MDIDRYKKALREIPKILGELQENENSIEYIFSSLKNVMNFDFAILYYINSDNLSVRYKKDFDNKNYPEFLNISSGKTRDKFYSCEVISFNNKSQIAKDLLLNELKNNFLIVPVSIKSTIFGIILFSKANSIFDEEDIEIAKSLGSICSYAIKDSELFDVFKMQFQILQDDIETKSNAYKNIQDENKKIVEANKIKNEVLANISHELRTPLNAIIGFSDILKAQFVGKLNEKQLGYVKDIHSSSINLLGMINEVLDISKIESRTIKLNSSNVDFSLLTTETVNIISPLAEKKEITINKNIKTQTLYCGDYQKLQQILFNLLSNAIKFTPIGGKIDISVLEDIDNFYLSVKDNGIGIDKKYHEHIFEKFAQVENNMANKESSTGLGLTIIKELVGLHGGKISINSEPAQGAEFIVELPK